MKQILLKDWPEGQFIFGYVDPVSGKVATEFSVEKYRLKHQIELRKRFLAQFPANTSDDNVDWSSVNFARFLNDAMHVHMPTLGGVNKPTRAMAIRLLPYDRQLFLLRQRQTKGATLPYPCKCSNRECAVDLSGEFPISDVPLMVPEEGDFEFVGGQWTYKAEYTEYDIRTVTMRLLTCEEEEVAASMDAGLPYQIGKAVLDWNGHGPMSMEQASEDLDPEQATAIREIGIGRVIGPDLVLNVKCDQCGAETPAVLDLSLPFLDVAPLKAAPRYMGQSKG